MRENSGSGKRTLVIAATVMMVVGFSLPILGSVAAHTVTPSPATPAGTTAAPSQGTAVPKGHPETPVSPNPGILTNDLIAPGGATSEDPAVAYDTVSVEPMINAFETLVSYNGSYSNGAAAQGPDGFVPVLATCVPGSALCTSDYGTSTISGFTGVFNAAGAVTSFTGSNGAPIYWTFVIDPAAQFYDSGISATGVTMGGPAHWSVYPSDVFFSIVREEAYSESIGVGNTPGWLVAQALLPNGTARWDSGLHAPYNTTPNNIYASMLVNASEFCPQVGGHFAGNGCITFVGDGAGAPWPAFLQQIGDAFMGTLACGWYISEGAGVPGWGTAGSPDTGPCTLPGGYTTTDPSQVIGGKTWSQYIAAISPTLWDSFESSLATSYPAPAPNIQWNMVGSGPYYAVPAPKASPPGYSLEANPNYAEPSGCSGAGGLAVYGGYCWPAAGKYISTVYVNYESSDAAAIAGFQSGKIDLGGIYTTDAGTMLQLASEGLLNYYDQPTLSTFFIPFNFNWSSAVYKARGLPSGVNIPDDFFSGAAARALMTHAFPYTTAENTANVVDGVQFAYMAGGPIAEGMVGYPTNVSYPYLTGDPDTNPSDVGSAAWWWAQGTSPSSPYYDPELAACIKKTCLFPIIGEEGAPNLDIMIAEYTSEIEAITSNHIQPYTFDLPFGGPGSLLAYQLGGEGPGGAPLPVWNLGWAADNFQPWDYLIPLAFPDSTYTYGDAVAEQLALPQYDNTATCGHSTMSLANLTYWATQVQLTSACQGVAYGLEEDYFYAQEHAVNPELSSEISWAIQAISSDLNLYTYFGQSNELVYAAPWINGQSVNYNPTEGGGNDQYYFQIQYVSTEYQVTFHQTGLHNKAWKVSAGSPATTKTNATGGAISFEFPSGNLPFTISSAAGVVTGVTGGNHTTTTNTTVMSAGTNLTATFTPVSTHGKYNLVFQESNYDLFNGTAWSVTITNTTKGALPPLTIPSGATAPSNITFSVTGGTSWKFSATATGGWKGKPATGSIKAVKGNVTTTIVWTQLFAKITFKEKGLAKNTPWNVTLSGYANQSGSIMLPFGVYTWAASPVAGYSTSSAGVITVESTKGQTFTAVYIAAKVTFKETGLLKGTSWTVVINASGGGTVATLSGTTSSLSTTLPGGTYWYNISAKGYTFSPNDTSFTISSSKSLTISVKATDPTGGGAVPFTMAPSREFG